MVEPTDEEVFDALQNIGGRCTCSRFQHLMLSEMPRMAMAEDDYHINYCPEHGKIIGYSISMNYDGLMTVEVKRLIDGHTQLQVYTA